MADMGRVLVTGPGAMTTLLFSILACNMLARAKF
jgi:hypothetical protein